MPSVTTITLYDGQATPVAHDFDRVSVNGSQMLLVNHEATTSAGKMQLIAGLSPATPARPTDKVQLRFNMPLEHEVDGITKVSSTARAKLELVVPDEWSQANRDDFAAYVVNAISDANIRGIVEDLDPLF